MRLSSLLSALPEALSAVEWRRQNASTIPRFEAFDTTPERFLLAISLWHYEARTQTDMTI